MPGAAARAGGYDGWLSPEALREVADALDLTPAYCQAVASFYDMFHLEPVGEHMVEVCTNVSCALVGAQQVSRRSSEELGVAPGETSEDGEVTLRTIECPAAAAGRRWSWSTSATASRCSPRTSRDRRGAALADERRSSWPARTSAT